MQATIHGVAKSGARLSDFTFFLSLVAQTVKNLPAMLETQVQLLGWEVPLEKGMAPTPVFLPEEFHGQRSLVCCCPWVTKSRSHNLLTEQQQISILSY